MNMQKKYKGSYCAVQTAATRPVLDQTWLFPDRSVGNVATSHVCAVAQHTIHRPFIIHVYAVAVVQYALLEANVKVNRAYLQVVCGGYHMQ